jgi:hypothetical protein
MQPVQIAMSGVTPGTYGNTNQIPTFTVDARGRLVFAANVDVQTKFNFKVNNSERIETVNLGSESFRFNSGTGIIISPAPDGIQIDFDTSIIQDTGDFVRKSSPEQQFIGPVKAPVIIARDGQFDMITAKEIVVDGSYTRFQTNGFHIDFTDYDVLESKAFQIDGISKNTGRNSNPNFNVDVTSSWIKLTSQIEEPDSTINFPDGHSLGIISFQDGGVDQGYGAGIIAIKNFKNDGSSPTGVCIITSNGKDNIFEHPVKFTFSGDGVFEAPVIKVSKTNSLPANPEEGSIVFDGSTKQFKGWNGSSWIVLG